MSAKKGKAGRNEFFYEHTFMGSPKIPKVEGIVQPPYKYMNYIEHDYEELFDLKKNPMETENLVADPRYKAQLTALRKKYQDWKKNVQ